MLKYIEDMTDVVFAELPDEVSLAINITNCQNRCKGCFEPFLRKDIGKVLDDEELLRLIHKEPDITAVLFMGEGNDPEELKRLAKLVKSTTNYKVALYSGREKVEDELYEIFDYIKVGPYREEYGPLRKKTTNQRLYLMENGEKKDITYKFWENKFDLEKI